MTTPPTDQQLDEIETRAAHLYEYVTLPTEANQLAGVDVPQLLASLRRARDRVAELEAFAYGCDAEGCVLPHSSWCDAAKKTAAANEGCTCGRPWSGHPQPHAMHCWTVNPPRAEVEEMRKRIAELSAAVAPDAASEATSAPLRASQPSSVSESAQSPTGAAEGAPRASGAAVVEEADAEPEFTEARAAFMQIGRTPSLEGLRAELRIEGWPPIVGSYNGAAMGRMHDIPGHEHLLAIEPSLIFEYADEQAARPETPAEETHIVADDSDDPEHVDDCPGCATA